MATPPVVPLPSNAKYDDETEGREKLTLTPNSEAMLDHLFCSDHATKKLECYCKHCEKPVCTDCIVEIHNGHGHSLEKLSTVYKERIDYFHHQKDQIENDLIPKYEALRAKEDEHLSTMKTRNDEIEKKIDSHISSVIEMVKVIGAQAIRDLRNAEIQEINKIDNFKDSIDKEVNKLQHINDMISASIGAQSNISFFKPIPKSNDLEKFQKLPTGPKYIPIEFHPSKINKLIQRELFSNVKVMENTKI